MKKLLYAGIIGPLVFISAFLVEGATRPGYSAWRNFVSQLATGPGGWVQVVNFIFCGTLVLLFAIGLRIAIGGTRGAIAGPLLLGVFGLDLIVAGIFSTDPALGYPVGAPPVHTLHGTIHGFAGLIAFTTLPAAALVMAAHFASTHERRWWLYSLVVSLVIIGFFVGSTVASAMDSSGHLSNAPTGFFQRIAIITGWTWLALVAWHQLRGVSAGSGLGSAAPRSDKPRPGAA